MRAWCQPADQLAGTCKENHSATGLDYLASPTGVIQDAQQLAAKAFGADQTWFLVNGTSGGIHAAVFATCSPEKCIVLARNCHQSAIAATVFAGKSTCQLDFWQCKWHMLLHSAAAQTA